MKLRFRKNTLRLRLNRKEVDLLAEGTALREEVAFPGGTSLVYLLEPFGQASVFATFVGGTIRIAAPGLAIRDWAESEAIGLYYKIPVETQTLQISIEKDLECVDGPEEERDPHAFTRIADAATSC